MNILSCTVLAGKFEDSTDANGYYDTYRNIKVAHSYPSLEEALIIHKNCVGFHFNELTMTVEIRGNKYDIALYPEESLMQATERGEIA